MNLGRMPQSIKRKATALRVGLLLLATGCLKTPDSEYVTNKEGLGTLIQDHMSHDSGVSISQQVGAPERTTDVCDDVNEYTTINIDAKVTVPETTALPVYRMSFVEMTEESAEDFAMKLFGEGRVRNRDGEGYSWVPQEQVYETIEQLNAELEAGISSEGLVIDEWAEEQYKMEIEFLQSVAPSHTSDPGYGMPVDYSFATQEWMLKNSAGKALGNYRLETCQLVGNYQDNTYLLTIAKDGINREMIISLEQGLLDYRLLREPKESNNSQLEQENVCKYSKEEAETLCRNFLDSLGLLDGMECGTINCLEWPIPDAFVSMRSEEYNAQKIINGYALHFYRTYGTGVGNGVQEEEEMSVLNAFSNNPTISWYASQSSWEYDESEEIFQLNTMQEVAILLVTDEGVIGADIINPMQVEECLAENVRLLEYNQILNQGKRQLEICYGDSGSQGSFTNYRIQSIELTYGRLQSPDTKEEYIMIPIWDFKLGPQGRSLVIINAIDGSVFDRKQGY